MLSRLRDVLGRSSRRGAARRSPRAPTRRAALEQLESRQLLASMPLGAMPDDTAEFLLGKVLVTPVFFESNGTIDTNQENWSPALIQQTKAKIEAGAQWWVDTLANTFGPTPTLEFQFDYTYADNPVATGYEPINRVSDDFVLWGRNFLSLVGYDTGGSSQFLANVRALNDAQRTAYGADWAFTILVANSQIDANDAFAPGGTFDRAFAYAGGLFYVAPSGRPASTFAHELGHIFYAMDEYSGGASYNESRGYYDTQNFNAADNPIPGFVQGDSIMASGTLLDNAWNNHTSAFSTLEMVGWRDWDRDGVMDVLDVPHSLDGSGYYDPAHGVYRFVGNSAVQTLPNQNPSGVGNDITINRIRRAEYRLDGGAWLTAAFYDTYAADLDLAIAAAPGSFQTIEIRTIDDATGVTSPIFLGHSDHATSTGLPGLNGFVWRDEDGSGDWNFNEQGLSGWTVQVVDPQGLPLSLRDGIEPDDYTGIYQPLNNVHPSVQLEAFGAGVANGDVLSRQRDTASTGSRVFGHTLTNSQVSTEWTSDSRQLHITFFAPVTTVSLDAVSNSDFDYGRLEIYNANNQLLGRYTTGALALGDVETMTLSRPTAEIAYAIATGHAGTAVRLDNLRFGPEAAAVTDAQGAWSIPYLPDGSYTVQVTTPSGWEITTPSQVDLPLSPGETVRQVNFGVQATAVIWQNPLDRFDVNDDGVVTPLDALLVINDLNLIGARELVPGASGPLTSPPYLDVSGDGSVSALDALLVINEVDAQARGGQPEAPPPPAAGGSATTEAESGGPAHPTHTVLATRAAPASPIPAAAASLFVGPAPTPRPALASFHQGALGDRPAADHPIEAAPAAGRDGPSASFATLGMPPNDSLPTHSAGLRASLLAPAKVDRAIETLASRPGTLSRRGQTEREALAAWDDSNDPAADALRDLAKEALQRFRSAHAKTGLPSLEELDETLSEALEEEEVQSDPAEAPEAADGE